MMMVRTAYRIRYLPHHKRLFAGSKNEISGILFFGGSAEALLLGEVAGGRSVEAHWVVGGEFFFLPVGSGRIVVECT